MTLAATSSKNPALATITPYSNKPSAAATPQSLGPGVMFESEARASEGHLVHGSHKLSFSARHPSLVKISSALLAMIVMCFMMTICLTAVEMKAETDSRVQYHVGRRPSLCHVECGGILFACCTVSDLLLAGFHARNEVPI